MALNENKKIAVWPTAKAACRMLWANRKQHIALSLVIFLPSLIIVSFKPDAEVRLYIVSFFSLFWLSALNNLWRRLFLVGHSLFLKITARQFLEMSLHLFAFYMKISILLTVAIPVMFCAIFWPLSIWYNHFASSGARMGSFQGLIAALAIAFIFLIPILRLMPTAVGISVKEKFSLRKSWSLMKEHAPRLLLTAILLALSAMLATIVGLILVSIAINLTIGFDNAPYASIIAPLLLSPLLTTIWVLPMAAQTIIYRDLVPQPEHLA